MAQGRFIPVRKLAASDKGAAVADKPMRRGDPERHDRQPLQAEGEIGAALRWRQGVNLIDDDPIQPDKNVQQRRLTEHYRQAFRRRQQYLRRIAEQR